jgi:hypothetical protein
MQGGSEGVREGGREGVWVGVGWGGSSHISTGICKTAILVTRCSGSSIIVNGMTLKYWRIIEIWLHSWSNPLFLSWFPSVGKLIASLSITWPPPLPKVVSWRGKGYLKLLRLILLHLHTLPIPPLVTLHQLSLTFLISTSHAEPGMNILLPDHYQPPWIIFPFHYLGISLQPGSCP